MFNDIFRLVAHIPYKKKKLRGVIVAYALNSITQGITSSLHGSMQQEQH